MSYICYSRVTDSDETFSTKIAEATACTARAIHTHTHITCIPCLRPPSCGCARSCQLTAAPSTHAPLQDPGRATCTCPRRRAPHLYCPAHPVAHPPPLHCPPSTAHCRIAFTSVFLALAVNNENAQASEQCTALMAEGRRTEAARRRGACCARMCLQLPCPAQALGCL